MKVSFSVHVCHRLKSLVGNVPNLLMGEFTFLLLQLIDITIEILKHEVKLVVFLDELQQLHDIGMM